MLEGVRDVIGVREIKILRHVQAEKKTFVPGKMSGRLQIPFCTT